jgi:hypothetical protein
LTEKTYLTVGDHTFWRKEVDRHHLCWFSAFDLDLWLIFHF